MKVSRTVLKTSLCWQQHELSLTNKGQQVPIIFVQRSFWEGLLNWFEDTLVANKTIKPEDLKLLTVVDTAKEVVDTIIERKESAS